MKLPENRQKAFFIHLAFTCLLCIPVIMVVAYLWYPGILFATEGGLQAATFLSAIIVPLGPGLTLLTYVPGKKGLKFDIVFILTLQLLSIAYGMYVMHNNRPAIVAYYSGTYYVIPVMRFTSREIDTSDNNFFQERFPVYVNVKLPSDKIDRLNVKIDHIFTGLETAIDLYEPYESALPLLSIEGVSINQAKAMGITVPGAIVNEKTRIFNLVTRYNVYAFAVNTETGEPVQVLSIIKTFRKAKR